MQPSTITECMLKLDVDYVVHSCVLFSDYPDTLIPEFRHHADWHVIHKRGMH